MRDSRLVLSVFPRKILSGRSQLVLPLAVQNCRVNSVYLRRSSDAPCLESASCGPLPWWHDRLFWQLLLGAAIGEQANEAVPSMLEGWRAMKAQFDIKTARTWPNLDPSERAKNTRGYILRLFGQTFVEDRLRFAGAALAHTHTHAQPKSVFSYAMAVMDNIDGGGRKMGGLQTCSVHVDLHKNRDLKRTTKHARVL